MSALAQTAIREFLSALEVAERVHGQPLCLAQPHELPSSIGLESSRDEQRGNGYLA